jgi:hypothetical protein
MKPNIPEPNIPEPNIPEPNTRPPVRQVANVDLRRAVLRVLVRAAGPVELGAIVAHLERVDRIAIAPYRAVSARQKVSDVLSWQVRRGRVRRIRRGVYEIVPSALSRSTRWRIERWELLRERRISRDGVFLRHPNGV